MNPTLAQTGCPFWVHLRDSQHSHKMPHMSLDVLYTTVHNLSMVEVIESGTFRRWVGNLRDPRAVARIDARLRTVSMGNIGDTRPVGDGVFEMRIHYGPGYRLYFIRDGATVVVLLCGGDKDSQERDIARAKQMAKEWR